MDEFHPPDLDRAGQADAPTKIWREEENSGLGLFFEGRTNQGGYHEQESFVDEAHVPIAQRK